MPTYLRPDDKPVVHFDPMIEISPFSLFRLLRDDRGPVLMDVRRAPAGPTFCDALVYPGDDWEPEAETRFVLFDRDGTEAEPIVRRLRAAGFENVKMLFGGLELYEFALDPQVVGEETFLSDSDPVG